MRNYFFILSACLFSLLAVSCSGNKEGVVILKLAANLSGNDVNPDFTLNEIFQDISFEQLAPNDTLGAKYPYLWSINKQGDACFVDFSNNKTINIHDKEGKLISTFNKIGKGEGEYLYPGSVLYDGEDEVTILGSMEKFIYKYDKNGVFKSKVPVSDITDIHPLPGGRFLCRTTLNKGVSNCIYILDSLGVVCDKMIPFDTTKNDFSYYNSSIMDTGDGYDLALHLTSKCAYYHYDIKENKFSEICVFDFGEYGVDDGLRQDFQRMNEYIMSLDPVRIKDYMFTNFVYQNKRFSDIWNLKTGELIARRVADFKTSGMTYFKYQLPNGEVLNMSLYPSFGHHGQLILSENPSKLEGKNIDGVNIDPEGNLVMMKVTLK